jgi:predicted Zn-dependent peptidase
MNRSRFASSRLACKLFAVAPVLLVALLAAVVRPAAAQAIVTPPPTSFELPAYKRVVFLNGLTVLLLEKHGLPLISAQLALRSGAAADPAGKEGIASITADLVRKGTATHSAEQVSADLDFIGMQYFSRVTSDWSGFSADFLKKDQDTALGILADLVLHPTFPDDEFKKLLAQQQDGIRSSKDEPQAVINLYFRHFLYGDTPYGRPSGGDENSLKAIGREDVLAFYRTHYTPANAILAVAGDFDSASMEAALHKLFDGWTGAAPKPVVLPEIKAVTGRKLLLVDKPDATQTYFTIGNIGINATNPDRAAIQVVNTLFGGRFTSLFNTELRIKSGYSYGAFSRFDQSSAPGPFTMMTYTRNATTEPAIDKSFEVLERAHKQGFTAEDLASAKNYIAGELPPRLETSQQLAGQLAENELNGISRDEFNQNLAKIQKTTLEDEHHVLDTYFPQSANTVIVVIGKASEIQKLLTKYTPNITVKKVSDPGF